MSLPEKQKVILIDGTSQTWETIKYTDVDTPRIVGDHDVIIRNKYAGVNMIEGYFRKGIYPSALPYILGREASGVVAAIGDKVTKFAVGDKVAYIEGSTFAQYTKITEDKLHIVKLPADTTEDELKIYGVLLIQGLTGRTFVDKAFKVEKDQYILVWAAAGGVGQILTQLIHQRGANVIAVASTDEKLQIAKSLGAKYLINSSTDDVVAKVLEITNGDGVNASFDAIGKDTFETSWDSLARKGTFISYGNASGPVPPILKDKLSTKDAKVVNPSVTDYLTTSEEFEYYTKDLINLFKSGKLKFNITKTYDLKDYAKAAQELEARKTTGRLVLKITE